MGVCSQDGRRVCSRLRPEGPVRTMRGGSREEVGCVGERKSLDGGDNSEEGGSGLFAKSSREGPALRASEKVVRGRRRGCGEDGGSVVAVAKERRRWVGGWERGVIGGV